LPGAVLGADSLQDYADLANYGTLLKGGYLPSGVLRNTGLYALNIASSHFAAVAGSREGGV